MLRQVLSATTLLDDELIDEIADCCRSFRVGSIMSEVKYRANHLTRDELAEVRAAVADPESYLSAAQG